MLMARLLLSLSLATIDVQTISLVVRSAVGVIPPTADRQGWALQRAALSGLFPRETTLPAPVCDVCYPRLSHLWRIGRIPRWWSGRSRVLARTYDRPLRPSRWLIVTGVLTLWFHVARAPMRSSRLLSAALRSLRLSVATCLSRHLLSQNLASLLRQVGIFRPHSAHKSAFMSLPPHSLEIVEWLTL